MPRRREVPKREILPDPKFGSVDLSKFMNVIMESGKKAVAEGIVYGAFDVIQARFKEDPLEVFRKALDNLEYKFRHRALTNLAQLALRYEFVHESDAQSLLRAYRCAFQHQRHRGAYADQRRCAYGAPEARMEAEIHFRQAERGGSFIRGHAVAAGEREFQAATEAEPVDSGHRGAGQGLQLVQHALSGFDQRLGDAHR